MLEEIFKHCVPSEKNSEENSINKTSLFLSVFKNNIFEEEEFYIYEFLKSADEMESALTVDLLDALMDYTLKSIMSKSKVKSTSTKGFSFKDSTSFKEASTFLRLDIHAYISSLMELDFKEGSFKIDVMKTKKKYHDTKFLEALKVGVQNSTNEDESAIRGADIVDEVEVLLARVKEVDTLFQELLGPEKREFKPRKVTHYNIKPVDDVMRGIVSTDLTVISGVPGAGKTTYVLTNVVYDAITKFGKNVLYYSVEQKESVIQNILIARRLFDVEGIFLSHRSISFGDYEEDPRINTKINITRKVLFNNEDDRLGRLDIIPIGELYTDKIIETVRAYERRNNIKYDLIVMDYMYAMQPSRITNTNNNIANKTQEAYDNSKKLATLYDKAVICIEQISRDGVANLNKGKTAELGDLAGGANVDRYADAIHIITGTEEERMAGLGYFQTVKSRNSAAVPTVKWKFNLMVGEFKVIGGEVL